MMNAKMFNQEYSKRFSEIANKIKSSATEVISNMNNAQHSRKIALRSQILRASLAILKARAKGFSEVTLMLEGIYWYPETFQYFTGLGFNILDTNGGYLTSQEISVTPSITISWREGSQKTGSVVHLDTKSIYDYCNTMQEISDMLGGDDSELSDGENLS